MTRPNSISRRVLLGALVGTAIVPIASRSRPRRQHGRDQEARTYRRDRRRLPSVRVRQGRQADRLRQRLVEDLTKLRRRSRSSGNPAWTGILAGVSTGKYDVAITAAIITKERKSRSTSPARSPMRPTTMSSASPREHQVDQGSERKDPGGVQAGSALLARLPELKTMPREGGGTMGKDRRVHLLSGSLTGPGARPGPTYVVNTIITYQGAW